MCSSENWGLCVFVSSAMLTKWYPVYSQQTVAQSPVPVHVAFLVWFLALTPCPLLVPAVWDIRSHAISFPKLFPFIWVAPVGPSEQFTCLFHLKQSPDLSGLLGFSFLTYQSYSIHLSLSRLSYSFIINDFFF